MSSCESASTSTVPQPLVKLTERPSDIKQVSESIWEFYGGPRLPQIPNVEVIFFHGLQFSNCKEAFWKTWLSRDEMVVWPKEWLAECFPNARMLSVSYDSSPRNASCQPDLFTIIENMITDLILSVCGAGQHCPVVLVGHSFGGIIIKSLLLKCNELKDELPSGDDWNRIRAFLENCKGVFYYSTPHAGSRLADYATLLPGMNISLMNLIQTLSINTVRINDRFSKSRQRLGIITQAIGESLPTKYKWFKMKLVEEASSKQDIDCLYYTATEADHFDVCRPRNKTTCSSFKILSMFISTKVLHNIQAEPGDQLAFDFPLPKHFVDDNNRVQLVIEKLQLQIRQPLCLAIIGMGGIGKTTLAKAVLIKISPKFDFVCFVNDVKREMKKKSLKLEKLLKGNLYRGRIKMHLDASQSLWSILKGHRLLLVMDGVDSEEQIDEISSRMNWDPSWFGEGSRVIVTSCSSQEFPPNFSIVQLEFLNPAESNKLFRSHLQPDIAQEMPKNLVEKVVRMCDGLPLTLEVIGRYLCCEKNESTWTSAIDRLNKAEAIGGVSNDKLWAKLKYSFENLNKREQDMFLDLVAFYDEVKHNSITEFLKFLKGAWASDVHGVTPESVLKNLEDRCFIRQTPAVKGQDGAFNLWIHEQLRNMGKSIACPLNQKELWSRVWEYEDAQYILTIRKGSSATKVLRFAFPDDMETPQVVKVHWNCLAKLKELRLLSIDGTKMIMDPLAQFLITNFTIGPQIRYSRDYAYLFDETHIRVRIQGSGDRFPCNLSLLRLHGCDNGSRHMPLLKIQDWPIRERDLVNLTNLGTLEIHHSRPVRLPPGFHKLTNLRVLELVGNKLKQLPADFGRLPSLETLIIVAESLESLPESFGYLSTLRYLHIRDCGRLQFLPDSFGLLSGLEEITLEGLGELRELPGNFGKLSHLRALLLSKCCCLKTFPYSFWQLRALQTLAIFSSNIPILNHLFCAAGYLSELQELKLLQLDELRKLPSSLGMLSHLRILHLNCGKLENLSDSFDALWALQNLLISGCDRLYTLPNSFGELRALEILHIDMCKSLRTLPNSFGKLQSLQTLFLRACENLHTLPQSIGHLSMLKKLTIRGVPLKELPGSFGMLSRLQFLEMEVQLKELPESFGLLSCLQILELVHCPKLERLCDNFGELNTLRQLLINDCPKLTGAVGLPTFLQEIREQTDHYPPLDRYFTSPLFKELKSFGWVQSAYYDASFCKQERSYRRPPDASPT